MCFLPCLKTVFAGGQVRSPGCRAGSDGHLRAAHGGAGRCGGEQGERREGRARVFTQAAALSAWLPSAPQRTVIRISGAGIMENLKIFQSNKKCNRKPPHLYEMTNLFSFNGRSS